MKLAFHILVFNAPSKSNLGHYILNEWLARFSNNEFEVCQFSLYIGPDRARLNSSGQAVLIHKLTHTHIFIYPHTHKHTDTHKHTHTHTQTQTEPWETELHTKNYLGSVLCNRFHKVKSVRPMQLPAKKIPTRPSPLPLLFSSSPSPPSPLPLLHNILIDTPLLQRYSLQIRASFAE